MKRRSGWEKVRVGVEESRGFWGKLENIHFGIVILIIEI